MNEGPYRGHVPAAKPYTLADSLREYANAAREVMQKQKTTEATKLWPEVVELVRASAKEGSLNWSFPDRLGAYTWGYKGVECGYFKELIEANGMTLEGPPRLASNGNNQYISWYKKSP